MDWESLESPETRAILFPLLQKLPERGDAERGDAASSSFLRNALQEIGKRDGFVADESLTENCRAEYGK